MAIEEFIFDDLASTYPLDTAPERTVRLYGFEDGRLRGAFANFHHKLNSLFRFMNDKHLGNRHFNADPSRELIDLIDEIDTTVRALRAAGTDVSLNPIYAHAIEAARQFLVPTNGSAIPDEYQAVEIEEYAPIFTTTASSITKATGAARFRLTLIGEGSYALVHKYVDDDYDITIARKKAKKHLTDQELARFKREYDLLRSIRFPNIVAAYRYDDAENAYTMEYCDETLDAYVRRTNSNLPFSRRKRIAMQLLYGVNFLHRAGIVHRDISRKNILIKHYDDPVVTVKLSDFGLAKTPDSDLTRTGSSMKGTIIDPTVDRFGDVDALADIYSLGVVLSFIFSGREHLGACTGPVQAVIDRCTHLDRRRRYAHVSEVIADVEHLTETTTPNN